MNQDVVNRNGGSTSSTHFLSQIPQNNQLSVDGDKSWLLLCIFSVWSCYSEILGTMSTLPGISSTQGSLLGIGSSGSGLSGKIGFKSTKL